MALTHTAPPVRGTKRPPIICAHIPCKKGFFSRAKKKRGTNAHVDRTSRRPVYFNARTNGVARAHEYHPSRATIPFPASTYFTSRAYVYYAWCPRSSLIKRKYTVRAHVYLLFRSRKASNSQANHSAREKNKAAAHHPRAHTLQKGTSYTCDETSVGNANKPPLALTHIPPLMLTYTFLRTHALQPSHARTPCLVATYTALTRT